MQEKRQTNVARSEAMRARLLAAARKLFADQGFAETGTPQIVKEADVTRGALYHHFADKTALFRTVVEAEAQSVSQEIQAAAGSSSTDLDDGARTFFKAMSVPGRVRILLRDGPAVLGHAEMNRIDAGAGGSTLLAALEIWRPDLAKPVRQRLAALLSAAFDRAALAIAEGDDVAPWLDAISALSEGTIEPR